MQVLILAHRPPYPPNKGERIRTYHQLEHLVRRGHAVSLCTTTSGADEDADLERLRHRLQLRVVSRRSRRRPLRLLGGLLLGKPLSVCQFYSRRLQRAVDRLLDERAQDAILCTSSAMAEYVFRSRSRALASSGARPRLVMDFMDLDSDKWREYAERRSGPMRGVYRREHRLLETYEADVHRAFDWCLFVSDNEVRLFERRSRTRGRVRAIGNGVAPPPAAARPAASSREGKGLLFTGVMDYFPNEDAMLWFCNAVWPSVRARHADATLVIAGMNPSARILELGRIEGVSVTGFLSTLEPQFARARVVIAPFRMARGVQNKVLEAFVRDVPVVCTAVAAEGIDCEADRHLLVADDAPAFADAIDRLLTDGSLADRLARAARSLVEERYGWEPQNQRLEALLGGARADEPVAGTAGDAGADPPRE